MLLLCGQISMWMSAAPAAGLFMCIRLLYLLAEDCKKSFPGLLNAFAEEFLFEMNGVHDWATRVRESLMISPGVSMQYTSVTEG